MTFTTENAAEMRAKRGYGKQTAPHEAPKAEPAPEAAVPTAPAERIIPLVLRCGWWPYEGTVYMDAVGTQQVYKTPIGPNGQVDEMARKRMKLEAGARIEVKASVARKLIDGGKATLDVGV